MRLKDPKHAEIFLQDSVIDGTPEEERNALAAIAEAKAVRPKTQE